MGLWVQIALWLTSLVVVVFAVLFIISLLKGKNEEKKKMNKNLVCIYDYCNECTGFDRGCCKTLDEPCVDKYSGKPKKVCPFFKTKEEVRLQEEKLKNVKYSKATEVLLKKVVENGCKKKESEKKKTKNN